MTTRDTPEAAARTDFGARRDAWRAYTTSPWGRIRYAVVAHTLRHSLSGLDPADGGPGLRVLDVAGGDGLDALPLARAGHRVTVLDAAPDLLADAAAAAAESGVPLTCLEAGVDDLPTLGLPPFDVVLCHFLLHYRDDPAHTLALPAAAVRPGGLLSLTAPNQASEALVRAARLLDPAGALAALTETTQHGVTFAADTRWVDADETAQQLRHLGFDAVVRYGIRTVTDLVADDARKHEPAFYADLERLELALCDREPYVRTARMWQLVARRAARPSSGG
ncbi:MAG: methyltransferase domain-containing protein [Actinobacteria bacterium]|nr:methyltransferase domain-containing protein [Actinomycetota bacterium]